MVMSDEDQVYDMADAGCWRGARLQVTCATVGTQWTVTLCGALDADSAIALECQLDQFGSGDFDEVVVDITGLTGIDRVGSVALESLGERVTGRGGRLRLKDHSSIVHAAAFDPQPVTTEISRDARPPIRRRSSYGQFRPAATVWPAR